MSVECLGSRVEGSGLRAQEIWSEGQGKGIIIRIQGLGIQVPRDASAARTLVRHLLHLCRDSAVYAFGCRQKNSGSKVGVERFESRPLLSHIMYLSIGLRKSPPPQNHSLLVYCYSSKHQVNGFVGEFTFKN